MLQPGARREHARLHGFLVQVRRCESDLCGARLRTREGGPQQQDQSRRRAGPLRAARGRVARAAAGQPAASGRTSRRSSAVTSNTERSGTSGQDSGVIGSDAICSAR